MLILHELESASAAVHAPAAFGLDNADLSADAEIRHCTAPKHGHLLTAALVADLFAGAHDALTLLSHKIIPGTVIVFDELFNYKRFREHEASLLSVLQKSCMMADLLSR